MTEEFTGFLSKDPDAMLAELSEHDPKKGAVLSMLMGIEAEVTPDGWDQPPYIVPLVEDWLDDTHYSLAAVKLDPLPMPDGAGGDWIVMFMHLMADTWLPAFGNLGQKLAGFAFLYEGWGVTDIDPDDEVTMMAARAHKLHTRPDRIECRILMAADRDGSTYSITRHRDGPLFSHVQLTPPTQEDGQIPEALRYLAGRLNSGD